MSPRLPDRAGFVDVLGEILHETTGTPLQFRDEGLLESAFARPENRLAYGEDADVCALAASLAYGLSSNHPLVDGNKRAAAAGFLITLFLNGLRLDASQSEVIDTFLALAAGELDEEGLAEWARARLLQDETCSPRP
ncbi:MAG: type II toxin-antitoxin system death-on-curing family toxin [Oceanicaulis sp.]